MKIFLVAFILSIGLVSFTVAEFTNTDSPLPDQNVKEREVNTTSNPPVLGLKEENIKDENIDTKDNNSPFVQYPYRMDIYKWTKKGYKYACGSVALTRNYLLTAAHCVVDSNDKVVEPIDLIVQVGSTEQEERQYLKTKYHVITITLHNEFKGKIDGYKNNVAIIELSKRFYGPLRPHSKNLACLSYGNNRRQKLTVLGTGISDNRLQIADFKEREAGECSEDEVCVDKLSPESKSSLCFGSNGDPLVTESGTVIGIGSFIRTKDLVNKTMDSDGQCDGYTVFSRISSYRKFIKNRIGNRFCGSFD